MGSFVLFTLEMAYELETLIFFLIGGKPKNAAFRSHDPAERNKWISHLVRLLSVVQKTS